jgi:hypothetical protein
MEIEEKKPFGKILNRSKEKVCTRFLCASLCLFGLMSGQR